MVILISLLLLTIGCAKPTKIEPEYNEVCQNFHSDQTLMHFNVQEYKCRTFKADLNGNEMK